MQFSTRQIDHIVYCVPDLEEAIHWFETNTGIRPTIGGRHLDQGTKNALVHMGDKCYLEILAIDKANTKMRKDRWMGVDRITRPRITRWCIQSRNLLADKKIIQQYIKDMGKIDTGKRETQNGSLLSWQMILPLSTPKVEIIPFMINWTDSDGHPTDSLLPGCKLIDIELHLNSEDSNRKQCMDSLFENLNLQHAQNSKISITLSCPKGILKI